MRHSIAIEKGFYQSHSNERGHMTWFYDEAFGTHSLFDAGWLDRILPFRLAASFRAVSQEPSVLRIDQP